MYAGKRPDPMDFRRILKAVFQPELSRIVSDDFRPVPTGKYRQLAGIHRKKSEKRPAGIFHLGKCCLYMDLNVVRMPENFKPKRFYLHQNVKL
jgi:hypothetical protein